MDVAFLSWGKLRCCTTRWKFHRLSQSPEAELLESASAAEKLALFLESGLPAARAEQLAFADVPEENTTSILLKRVWKTTTENGVSPSHLLHNFAAALRANAENIRLAQILQVGPQAAKRIMMILPVAALLGATVLGNGALAFLCTNPLGWFLTGAAMSLMWIAHLWSTRLVHAATLFTKETGLLAEICAMFIAAGFPPQQALQRAQETLDNGEANLGEWEDVTQLLALAEAEGIKATQLLHSSAQLHQFAARDHMRISVEALAVKLVLPLGLCVLPAFVCVGVIPVIFSMISSTSWA